MRVLHFKRFFQPQRQGVDLYADHLICVNIRYDKPKETCDQILTSHERMVILVFGQEQWLVGGDPFYMKIWVKKTLLE